METIYDKCAYKNCRNGRYTTGSHLFRFPSKQDARQKLWIRNSGKFCIFFKSIFLHIFEIVFINKSILFASDIMVI